MANRRNRYGIALLLLPLFAAPAAAQDYDYLSRADGISISGGDAPKSNIAIQHPTPWPPYVDDVDFGTPGRTGVIAIDNMYKRLRQDSRQSPSTVINIGN